jgi:hypothetical protein
MYLHRFISTSIFTAMLAAAFGLSVCGGGSGSEASASVASVAAVVKPTQPAASSGAKRPGFLGAFFRPEGSPPFGVFSAPSPAIAPQPYPTTGANLVGPSGYCNQVAANGVSIATGNVVDPTKLADITNLGVGWTRMPAPQFFDDGSHIFGPGHYTFGDFDSAQCSTLAQNGIRPVIGLEAGPVEYNATPGVFSPQSYPQYKTAADFGQWCGAVATHERNAFPSVSQFSLPGNEVNSNPQLFPAAKPRLPRIPKRAMPRSKRLTPPQSSMASN